MDASSGEKRASVAAAIVDAQPEETPGPRSRACSLSSAIFFHSTRRPTDFLNCQASGSATPFGISTARSSREGERPRFFAFALL